MATKTERRQASAVLKAPRKSRVRRSNSGFFEETSEKPDFQRECLEERCTNEELTEFIDYQYPKIIKDHPNLAKANFMRQKKDQLYSQCYLKQNFDKNKICSQYGTLKCTNIYNDYKCECNEFFKGKHCTLCLGTDKDCHLQNKICSNLGTEAAAAAAPTCQSCYQAYPNKPIEKFDCSIKRDHLQRLTNECECVCRDARFNGQDCNLCGEERVDCRNSGKICAGLPGNLSDGSLNKVGYECRTCYEIEDKDPDKWDCQLEADDSCTCEEQVQTTNTYTLPKTTTKEPATTRKTDFVNTTTADVKPTTNETIHPFLTTQSMETDDGINPWMITGPIVFVIICFLVYMLHKEAKNVRKRSLMVNDIPNLTTADEKPNRNEENNEGAPLRNSSRDENRLNSINE